MTKTSSARCYVSMIWMNYRDYAASRCQYWLSMQIQRSKLRQVRQGHALKSTLRWRCGVTRLAIHLRSSTGHERIDIVNCRMAVTNTGYDLPCCAALHSTWPSVPATNLRSLERVGIFDPWRDPTQPDSIVECFKTIAWQRLDSSISYLSGNPNRLMLSPDLQHHPHFIHVWPKSQRYWNCLN